MNWLAVARELQTIAQAGLTYSKDPFDLERFARLREMPVEIVAAHGPLAESAAALALSAETGYATPKVDVRAAVFRDGRLLFARERAEGLWSLPGGWADLGQSPAESVVREVWEETGYRVRATKVLGVFDRDRQGHPPMLWSVYKVFFRCEIVGGEAMASVETDAVAFYGRDEVPPLSLGRVTLAQVARLFAHHDDPDLPADFD